MSFLNVLINSTSKSKRYRPRKELSNGSLPLFSTLVCVWSVPKDGESGNRRNITSYIILSKSSNDWEFPKRNLHFAKKEHILKPPPWQPRPGPNTLQSSQDGDRLASFSCPGVTLAEPRCRGQHAHVHVCSTRHSARLEMHKDRCKWSQCTSLTK